MNPAYESIMFFDLETTGTDTAKDKIVSIGLVEVIDKGQGFEIISQKEYLINPAVPIPEGASNVHGITDDMVKDAPLFSQVAQEIYDAFKGKNLGGFNILRFDIPMLNSHFANCKFIWPYGEPKIIDVFKIYQKNNPRTLTAAVKQYLDKDHTDAHGAEADTVATAEIFIKQLEMGQISSVSDANEISTDGNKMVDYAGALGRNEAGDIIFNFGKWRGSKVLDHLDYANWMMGQDFSADTKNKLLQIVNKQYLIS